MAVVVGQDSVDAVGLVGQNGVHNEGDGGLAGGILRFNAVDIPAQVFGLGILAAQLGFQGVVHPEDAGALPGDFHRGAGEHSGHIQILLEAAVGTGAAGDAIAPVDEEVALGRHSRHGDRLIRRHVEEQRGLAGGIAAGQGAAGLVDAVAGLKGLAVGRLGRAGRNRIAGIAGVLQGTGGNVAGIGTAVLGLISVGGQVVQNCLQAAALEVDIAADIVVVQTKAGGGILQHLGAVEELDAQVLAHGQQGHVEVIDLLLRDGGIVGVVLGDRRNGVDNDVGIRIAGLDILDQLRIIADEGLHFHGVVVGAQGDDHTAGLHHRHGLGHGVALIGSLKGDQLLREGALDADALLGTELLKGDQAIVVQTNGVGIAQEQGVIEVGLSGVCCLSQQSGGLGVHLIVVGQIVRLLDLRNRAGGISAPGGKEYIGDAGRNQNGQRTHSTYKNCLFLDRCHRL